MSSLLNELKTLKVNSRKHCVKKRRVLCVIFKMDAEK